MSTVGLRTVELGTFRSLVEQLSAEIPSHYLDGVAAIDVSPRTVPQAARQSVYTLGECIPIYTGTDEIVSRVVLYYGSFRALAAEHDTFDWRREARDTLYHEVQHHLEWRADSSRLEEYDWAVDQNQRRTGGEPYDALFYQAGQLIDRAVYRVEDDLFIEREVRKIPTETDVTWRGARYRVAVPRSPLPMYLQLDGLDEPIADQVYLVLRRTARLWDLFRARRRATEHRVRVVPIG
jgi:hypothetical protein